MSIKFGIVTPTFNRRVLLRRHLQRLAKQTYAKWQLLIVHDGPNAEIRSDVEAFRKKDERIDYFETAAAARDSGVTPRLEGAKVFLDGPNYVLFWDDDNAYAPDTLERLATSLERANRPDLMICRVHYGELTIPPVAATARSIKIGEIDTACLAFRPQIALTAYEAVQRHAEREQVMLCNDFLAYDYANRMQIRIEYDPEIVIGRHDGLRWGPFIRRMLGVPPLGIGKMVGLGR